MGNTLETFFNNIPIVYIGKKIFSSGSSSPKIHNVGSPVLDNPIILLPKPGPMRGIPNTNPQGNNNSNSSSINQENMETVLVYLIGGTIIFILLIR